MTEALRVIQARMDVLKRSLDFAVAMALPPAQSEDIVIVGREAQLTTFCQKDQPSPGQVLVTTQIARHSLGGVTSLRLEQGLVVSPDGLVRAATDDELLASGGEVLS